MGPARQPHALMGGIHPSGLKHARARAHRSAVGRRRIQPLRLRRGGRVGWFFPGPAAAVASLAQWHSAVFLFSLFCLISKNSTGQNINPNALIPISKFLEYCNLFNGATFTQIQPPFLLCKYLNVVFSI